MAIIVACGGTAAPTESTGETAQVAAPANTVAVRATNTPAPEVSQPTPTQRASVHQATPRPTLAPLDQEGELNTDRLIVVLDTPILTSMLDCEVTGSGVVNYRMSAEFMVDASRFDGSYEPMLATEWSITPDGRTWNFKLRQGVPWQHGWGDFTAQDVKHSMAYYTNPECRASYSDFFRTDPGVQVEIVNDYEVNMHMQLRPAVDFIYWYSGFRGIPQSSKAQWDQECRNGEADYGETDGGVPLGYCKASRDKVYEMSARTGPYEFVSFQESVGWVWEAVDYDHWRVDPDFREIEIRDVKEPATRLAIMQAREGHIAAINRALLQNAINDGLEVFDSSVVANTSFALFGGLFYTTGESGVPDDVPPETQAELREEYNIVAGRDEIHPWNIPGETGKLVRQAMNKAIDRDQINEAIFSGVGAKQWVATLAPDLPNGYNPAWEERWDELYGYDPERARELLAEAGYPEGFTVKIPIFTLSAVPEMPDMMEAMAKFWTAIGLNPEMDNIESATWVNHIIALDTDCCVYPFRGPAAPIDTRVHFYFSAERYFRAYTSDDIQETKNRALRSLNEADAVADWQRVADEIFYQVGTIPGWSLPVSATVDPDVVAEYIFLGPNNGNYVYLEYVKGVRE
jgi:ABC-type transport system substrate-binding protein